ncbi:hypothetical protein J2Z60_001786 [Lactobacillus colini]|uniref:Uncharacterized protein n=1 Tax=Lactobacillus colini TaxID=1819254 RepID=A0ABS4MFZ0_9LACO|nr:hypothetical protein [Lactobacillus colini]MBP2058598.1 hypothetical protein [Lactobacillus colini]
MHDPIDSIEKVAELIFYTVSTVVLVKQTWFSKKQNSHKKKRKKRKNRKR